MDAEKVEELTDEITEDATDEVTEEVNEEETEETEDIEPEVVEEKPAWMEDGEDTVPLGTLTHERKKLKGKLDDKESRIQELETELAARKTVTETPDSKPVKRPRINEFDTDEEYEEAMDKYDNDRFESISTNLSQSNTQKTQQDRLQQEIGKNVTAHYDRAEELVKQHAIDPDVYKTADRNVRQTVEDVLPNQGNQSVDFLISKLGDDSEKVMFNLGRNKKKLAELKAHLVEDPNGISAAMWLGELKHEIKTKINKTSQARKPAPSVKGDKVTSAKGNAEKRKFEAAQKDGNDQVAYNIKKAAKEKGIDTKKW